MGKIIFIIIIVVLVGWIISKRNEFEKMREMIKTKKGDIKIQEKKRFEAIDHAMKVAKKAYANEVEGIERLTAGDQLEQLQFLMEKYPSLASIGNYTEAVHSSFGLSADIAAARKLVNGNIQAYNIAIGEFPGLLVARMFGYKKEKLIDEDRLEEVMHLGQVDLDFSQY